MAFGAPFPGGGSVALTFLDSRAALGGSGGSATFTGVNFGTPAPNRSIVVASAALGSVTIGGIAATKVASVTSGVDTLAIWIALVPTGTSGSVAIAGAGSILAAIAVYAMTGNASQTPSATGTSTANPPHASVAVPSNGVMIAAAASEAVTSPAVWTGPAEDVDLGIVNAIRVSTASLAANNAQTVNSQCTMAGNNGTNVLVAAAWGP